MARLARSHRRRRFLQLPLSFELADIRRAAVVFGRRHDHGDGSATHASNKLDFPLGLDWSSWPNLPLGFADFALAGVLIDDGRSADQPVSVPEPGSLWLLAAGLLGFAARSRLRAEQRL